MTRRHSIGILGTIGYDDYGDDALLLCNVEELLKRDYNLIIFSHDIGKTKNLLLSNGLLPTHAISDRIDVVTDLNAYVDKKRWLYYLNLVFEFGGINAVRTAYFQYLDLKLARSITAPHSLDPMLSEIIKNISKCSFILNMGGGYINCYHKSKIYSSILTLSIADQMRKTVVAYGQTFGPLDKMQKYMVKKHIKKIHHITLRDHERSKERLIELGFPANRISESPDDAIFLNSQKNNEQIERILESFENKFIVVTNFGLFLNYSKMSMENIHLIFAQFFDFLVEEKDAIILNISMTSSGTDIKQGLSIQQKMKNKASFFHLPLYTGVREIKTIIGKSNLTFSSRLHPIVFAISEKKPFIGISSGGEYYDSKLIGITEIYGYDPTKHIINADNLSLDLLIQRFGRVTDAGFTVKEDIYISNRSKRERDLDNIKLIIDEGRASEI